MRGRLDGVLRGALDRDTSEEPHAELVERGAAERGEWVVQAVERPLEHVDERDGVPGLGQRGGALRPDQPRSDDDDLDRPTGQQRAERVERAGSR